MSHATNIMHWLPLSLLCAIALAAADALTKKLLPDYQGWELVVIRFGVPALLLLPLALANPIPPVPLEFFGWMLLLIPMEIIAMLLYVVAIRDTSLAHTLPYLAFTPVFTLLTGFIVLGESVSLHGVVGVLLVVTGAYLLNIEHLQVSAMRTWLAPFFAVTRMRGSRLMLVVAAIYSVTSVLGKHTMEYVTPETFGAFYYTVVGLVMLLLITLFKPASLRVLVHRPGPHLVIGLLMAFMVVTHFLAIARVEVAYMISVKRSSLLFGILFGALLFRERMLATHLLAGTFMVAGVAIIVIQA